MRISESKKQTLQRAAALHGVNLTAFVLQSAMEKAKETLEQENRIELSRKDMKKLLEILENSESNSNLQEAFSHYQKVIG